jgi:hypothetical protein
LHLPTTFQSVINISFAEIVVELLLFNNSHSNIPNILAEYENIFPINPLFCQHDHDPNDPQKANDPNDLQKANDPNDLQKGNDPNDIQKRNDPNASAKKPEDPKEIQ